LVKLFDPIADGSLTVKETETENAEDGRWRVEDGESRIEDGG
jgi:hypothetical protein